MTDSKLWWEFHENLMGKDVFKKGRKVLKYTLFDKFKHTPELLRRIYKGEVVEYKIKQRYDYRLETNEK